MTESVNPSQMNGKRTHNPMLKKCEESTTTYDKGLTGSIGPRQAYTY